MPRKPKYLTGDPYYDDEEMYDELPFLRPDDGTSNLVPGPNPWTPNNYNQHMFNKNAEESPSWNWGQISDNAKYGLYAGQDAYNYANTPYADEDPYLKDSNGNYYYEKTRGSPDDPNYFWDPYTRKTNNKIKKNWISDLRYNQFGSRNGVYTKAAGSDDFTIQLPNGQKVNPSNKRPRRPSNNPSEYSGYGNPRIIGESQLSYEEGLREKRFRQDADIPQYNYRSPLQTSVEQGIMVSHSKPQVHMEGASMVFINDEYILDVGGKLSSDPSGTNLVLGNGFYKISVNAGLPLLPVLSQVAQAFTFYKFRKICFKYISTSSNSLSTTNPQLGQLIMAYKTNTAQPDFANIYEMMNYSETVVSKPANDCHIELDCANSQESFYYTRYDPNTFNGYNASTPGQASPILIDQFNFYLACVNCLSQNTVGILRVSYECEMRQVQLIGAQVGYNILYNRANFVNYVSGNTVFQYFSVEDIPDGFKFGSQHGPLLIKYTDNGDSQIGQPGTGSITFPPWLSTGTYQLQYAISFDLTSYDPNSQLGYSFFNGIFANCLPLSGVLATNGYTNDTSNNVLESAGTGAYQPSEGVIVSAATLATNNPFTNGAIFTIYVQITGTNAKVPCNLTFSAGSQATTFDHMYGSSISITQVNPDFGNAFNSGYYVNS